MYYLCMYLLLTSKGSPSTPRMDSSEAEGLLKYFVEKEMKAFGKTELLKMPEIDLHSGQRPRNTAAASIFVLSRIMPCASRETPMNLQVNAPHSSSHCSKTFGCSASCLNATGMLCGMLVHMLRPHSSGA